MTDQELKDLVASIAVAQMETARLFKELREEGDRRQQELAQLFKERREEGDRRQEETARQIKELGKQIGGLGNKFGDFTEDFAWPSISRVLEELGATEVWGPRLRAKRHGHHREFDGIGWTNTEKNAVWVVEIKSRLRPEYIDQFVETLRHVQEMFPEHRDKHVYGILTVVNEGEDLQQQVLDRGLYFARIHDDVFALAVPEGFEPKSYGAP